jgi:hypothetical protein
VNGLQTKLLWYVENQQLINNYEQESIKHKQQITQLNEQISMLERLVPKDLRAKHGIKTLGTGIRPRPVDLRKIKSLEQQVHDLQELMKSKYPDSISGLIQATKPNIEDTELIHELRSTISQLQNELEQKEEEMMKKLRSLRLEHDQIRAGYEKRISILKTKEASKPKQIGLKTLGTNNRRLKTLQLQYEEMQLQLTTKIETLQLMIQMYANGEQPTQEQFPNEYIPQIQNKQQQTNISGNPSINVATSTDTPIQMQPSKVPVHSSTTSLHSLSSPFQSPIARSPLKTKPSTAPRYINTTRLTSPHHSVASFVSTSSKKKKKLRSPTKSPRTPRTPKSPLRRRATSPRSPHITNGVDLSYHDRQMHLLKSTMQETMEREIQNLTQRYETQISLLHSHCEDTVQRLEQKQNADLDLQRSLLTTTTEEVARLREQLRFEGEERNKLQELKLKLEFELSKARNQPVSRKQNKTKT